MSDSPAAFVYVLAADRHQTSSSWTTWCIHSERENHREGGEGYQLVAGCKLRLIPVCAWSPVIIGHSKYARQSIILGSWTCSISETKDLLCLIMSVLVAFWQSWNTLQTAVRLAFRHVTFSYRRYEKPDGSRTINCHLFTFTLTTICHRWGRACRMKPFSAFSS